MLVIKTHNSLIETSYQGDYPWGSVVYEGVLNGEPLSVSISTEINPRGLTDSQWEFNSLVLKSGAVPHISLRGDGNFSINFVGEGWPCTLSKGWTPAEVRGIFRSGFLEGGIIPSEALEAKRLWDEKDQERKAKIQQWLNENPDREEWEYGLDDEEEW